VHYQSIPPVAVFHAGSVDVVVSGASRDSIVLPAASILIEHCTGQRID
jgi:hypothetical protein